MNNLEPEYLGDGVYCHHDGYHVVLTTGHHLPENADNVIALDDQVITYLMKYIARVKNVK